MDGSASTGSLKEVAEGEESRVPMDRDSETGWAPTCLGCGTRPQDFRGQALEHTEHASPERLHVPSAPEVGPKQEMTFCLAPLAAPRPWNGGGQRRKEGPVCLLLLCWCGPLKGVAAGGARITVEDIEDVFQAGQDQDLGHR